jgi:TM2 domain-containing membrane protein YozV
MKKTVCFLLILAAVIGSPAVSWGQTAPLPDASFADWLYSLEEYIRAAGEYYRVLFNAPPAAQDALLYKIGACYLKAQEYRKALLAFERIITEHPRSPRLEDAYYDGAYCSYKLGEYQASFNQISRLATGASLAPRFLLLAGAGSLLSGNWDGAGRFLSSYLMHPDLPFQKEVTALVRLTEEASAPETRSALAAGFFSAIIPGSGKIYAGRWEDGLVSLLLCGLFGGLAAYHFVTDGGDSAPAWMYTALGGVFYIGNIYGSVVAAQQFNEQRLAGIRQRIQISVQVILP